MILQPSSQLLEIEPQIRLTVFLSILAVMILLELFRPLRTPSLRRISRWPSNLGIVLIDTGILRLILPFSLVAFALKLQNSGTGLLNQAPLASWSQSVKIVIGVAILDWVIYFQHRLFHKVPLLWRVHRVHHADLDFDVTTALRFHPIEILLSAIIKLGAVTLLGTPAVSVLAFEVILNGVAMFNHGNIQIPRKLEPALRLFVVTPDMHRIHHSVIPAETHSNFGFNLPWWDRLFGTYVARPTLPQSILDVGLPEIRTAETAFLTWMLLAPFRSETRNPIKNPAEPPT